MAWNEMKVEPMTPKILLTLTGMGIGGDAFISLLHGDFISGGTALAMVIIYFSIMRRIDKTNSTFEIFQAAISKDISDIKNHLNAITKTVIKGD